jgi:16S rRNA (cytosine967-C5)-methyltransferase
MIQARPDLLRSALPRAPDEELAARADRPFLRDAAVAALAVARAEPTRAGAVLAGWFRQARRLGARDRPVVTEAVHGIIRHEHFLGRAGFLDDAARYQGWRQLVGGERFAGLGGETPERDFATALSLPVEVATEWLARLGPAEACGFAHAQAERAPLAVRANALRCTRDALRERLAAEGVPSQPCERAPLGLQLLKRVPLPALGSFRDGWLEVQDESSQLLVEAIPLAPGDSVLDLCAGAGGKALALAARGARVRAWDTRKDALAELQRRAARAGAPIEIGPPRPARIVLCDAPCTGTGRLRREPTLRWGLQPGRYLERQRRLLAQAAALVLPGGFLVYATCSLLAAENGHLPPDEGGGPWSLRDAQTLWPHREGTDGFAWAVWRTG